MVRTQFVVMVFAASSRQAPKPLTGSETTPYWQDVGSAKRFAVDMTLSGSRSRSVSGIRFTKTEVSAMSSNAEVPPMPDPMAGAAFTS